MTDVTKQALPHSGGGERGHCPPDGITEKKGKFAIVEKKADGSFVASQNLTHGAPIKGK